MFQRFLAHKKFSLFIFILFLGRASWFMTMPFMAIYFSKVLHAGPIEIGFVLGGGLLTSCVSGLFIGGLIDRFSAKPVLFLAMLCSALIYFSFMLPLSLLEYGILNLFLGVFRSALDTSSQSYIMMLLPEEARSKGLNLRYMVINVSAIIGPLFGALLVSKSTQTLFFMAAGIYVVSAALLNFLPKSYPSNAKEPILESLKASSRIL